MPYSPFNYGNAIAQAEGIRSSQMQNALRQEQLNALRNPQVEGPNIGTYNPRDYTSESWSKFIQTRDPSVLDRFSTLRPGKQGGVPGLYNVITGEFIPGSTIEAEMTGRAGLSFAEQSGDQAARAGQDRPTYSAPAQAGELQPGTQSTPPEQTPVTEASLAADKAKAVEAAKVKAALDAKMGAGGGTTEAEVAAAKAREETIAKEQATRGQDWINRAASAAEAYPVIGRALQLLDKVDTGGIDSVKLAASNFFGVTGADEAELSNNLGKAVLSQLRETFGAAFTVEEGKRLERIEANYGKSTAGNKRLLQQAQRILDNVMKRGLKAAQDTGDQAAIDAINSGYTFDLSIQPGTGKDVDFSTLSDEELKAILAE